LLLKRADLLSQHAQFFAQVMIRLPGNADGGCVRIDDGFRNRLADLGSSAIEGRRLSALAARHDHFSFLEHDAEKCQRFSGDIML
jgi:hypothetical protein